MLSVNTRRVVLPPTTAAEKSSVENLPLWACSSTKSGRLSTLIQHASDYPRSSRSGHDNRRSHSHDSGLVLLAGASQVVGRGLVDVVVEPVGVEQLSLAAPDVSRLGGGVVARKVMRRHLRVEPALHVALVLQAQRVGIVLGVAKIQKKRRLSVDLTMYRPTSSDTATTSSCGSASTSSRRTSVLRECTA